MVKWLTLVVSRGRHLFLPLRLGAVCPNASDGGSGKRLYMARRWTPQRFMKMRRVRVAVCAITVAAMAVATFALTTRKAVALNVNGKTTMVATYAMTVDRLLEEQGISVKSHDLVQSTSGGTLADGATA